MKPLKIMHSLEKSPVLRITSSTTPEEADAAFPRLADFNTGGVFVGRFQGSPPWERHQHDELLHVLSGRVEVTLLSGTKEFHVVLKRGEFLVVPKGFWHRPVAFRRATLISVTPQPTEISFDDPRKAHSSH